MLLCRIASFRGRESLWRGYLTDFHRCLFSTMKILYTPVCWTLEGECREPYRWRSVRARHCSWTSNWRRTIQKGSQLHWYRKKGRSKIDHRFLKCNWFPLTLINKLKEVRESVVRAISFNQQFSVTFKKAWRSPRKRLLDYSDFNDLVETRTSEESKNL